jgi:hypothetical protein
VSLQVQVCAVCCYSAAAVVPHWYADDKARVASREAQGALRNGGDVTRLMLVAWHWYRLCVVTVSSLIQASTVVASIQQHGRRHADAYHCEVF